jgi:hypothetical protein
VVERLPSKCEKLSSNPTEKAKPATIKYSRQAGIPKLWKGRYSYFTNRETDQSKCTLVLVDLLAANPGLFLTTGISSCKGAVGCLPQ